MLLGSESTYQRLAATLEAGTSGPANRHRMTFIEYGHDLHRMMQNCLASQLTPTADPLERVGICRAYIAALMDGWFSSIKELSQKAEAMKPTTKISVCIPVALLGEERNIVQTLAAYESQTLPKDSFEILLLLNHPTKMNSTEIQGALRTVEAVCSYCEGSKLQIVPLTGEFDCDLAGIGLLRKILHDVAIYRHTLRPNAGTQDLLMVANDADTRAVGRQYLEGYLQQAELNPLADCFVGGHVFDTRELVTDPPLLLLTHLYEHLVRRVNKLFGDTTSGAPNFAISAASYCMVGGFEVRAKLAENLRIQRDIAALRLAQNFPLERHVLQGGLKSRIYTSPRRLIAAAKRGFWPWQQWGNQSTRFLASGNDIRANLADTPLRKRNLDYTRLEIGIISLFKDICIESNFLIDNEISAIGPRPSVLTALQRFGITVEPAPPPGNNQRLPPFTVSFNKPVIERVVAKLVERCANEIPNYQQLLRKV